MVIEIGEKVHIMYRSIYENSTRRHFIGEVVSAKDSLCRLVGFVFIYDTRTTEFIKKPDVRTTIIDLAESGYIVNVIDSSVVLKDVSYKYTKNVGLVATDDRDFVLNINEFGIRS